MRKAFGRGADLLALALGAATLTTMLVVLDPRLARISLPATVALGPLMVAQHAFWRRRLGSEHSTWQYQQAESVRVSARGVDAAVHQGVLPPPRQPAGFVEETSHSSA